MKRFFLMRTVTLFFSITISLGSYAQKKTVLKEYSYQASESDSKVSARAAAINQMRKLLLMEVGESLYAQTQNETKSSTVNDKEEITQVFLQKMSAVSSGVVETKVLHEEWNGVTYFIKAELTIDMATVGQQMKDVFKDKDNVKQPSKKNETIIADIQLFNLGDGRYFGRTAVGQEPLDGEYKIIDGYNSIYITMSFKEGLVDGKYSKVRSNRLVEEGNYTAGVMDGIFKEYNYDGVSLKKVTPYTKGKLNGMVKTFFTTGKVATEKGYSNGVEHGIEKRYTHDTGECVAESNYVHGRLDGKERRKRTGSIDCIEVRYYTNGLLHGNYTSTFLNDLPYEKGAYANGKKDGVWICFTERGDTVSIESYKTDLLNGKCVKFNRGKREGVYTYKNDKKEGLSVIYNSSGDIVHEISYKNNKPDGVEKRWVISSQNSYVEETTYVSGAKHGPYKSTYLTDGKLKSSKGTVKEKGQFHNGSRVGNWVKYDVNGAIVSEWSEGN